MTRLKEAVDWPAACLVGLCLGASPAREKRDPAYTANTVLQLSKQFAEEVRLQ